MWKRQTIKVTLHSIKRCGTAHHFLELSRKGQTDDAKITKGIRNGED